MDRIVVFGKGGVGKSTFAAHLSAWFAAQGRKVLHIGCDPKADSSLLLLDSVLPPRTVVEILSNNPTADPQHAINRGRLGIDCIEVGGPEPGIGCGGRGITWALDFLEKGGLLARAYDVVLFDVLGDVVCGGFAAPLRRGLADLVLILASPDEMSFFAANNIARAVVRYAGNGVALAGLVLNQRSDAGQDLDGPAFARAIGAGVLGTLPFSPTLADARRHRRTLSEIAPDDPFAAAVAGIGKTITTLDRMKLALPHPLDRAAFSSFIMPPGRAWNQHVADAPHPRTGRGNSAGELRSDPGGSFPAPTRSPQHDPSLRESAKAPATILLRPSGFEGQVDHRPSTIPLAPTSFSPPQPDRIAGPSTLARLTHLLGFDLPEFRRAGAGVAAAVLSQTGELRLTVSYGKLPPQRLILLPPGRDGAYLSLPEMGIAYHGADPSVALHKLARFVAGRLGDIRFETLAGWVADAPDSVDPAVGTDGAAGVPLRTAEGRVWSLRAGAQALATLSGKLFSGGPRGPHGAALVRADARTDSVVELDFALEDGSVRSLLVVPLGQPSFIDVATCGVGHAGEADEVSLDLVRTIAVPLALLRLDSLHEVVRADPESSPVGRPGGPEHDDASFRQTPQWRQFFADDHFARNVHQLLQYEAPHVAIEHCDRECLYPTPPALEYQPDVYNYPWLEPPPYRGGPLARKGAGGTTLTTDLTDADVVRGTTVRLEDVLGRVAEGLEDEQFVLVHNTCTPVVAGEDVSGLVHRAGASCPIPLMHTAPHLDGNPLAEFFARRKKERGFAPHNPDPRLVNLVGFPTNRGTEELCRLLSLADIRINDRAFPQVDLRVFDTYLRAAVQVFYPEHYLGRLRDALFSDLPMATLVPEAPYGFERTVRWLTAVTEAAGAPLAAPKSERLESMAKSDCCNAITDVITDGWANRYQAVEEVRLKLLPEWDRLRGQASTCTLGFVVDSWRIERLADPSVNFALPLLPLLSEMGFGLELLLYSAGGAAASTLEAAARALVQGPGLDAGGPGPPARLTTHCFSTEEELASLLVESSAQAFYSDFSQDRRLAQAGKAHFSSQVFEMGFAGAVRTLERLLAVCCLPFFQRFGRVGWP